MGFYNKVLPYADQGQATVFGHFCRALSVYHHWMERHSAAIYSCTQSEFRASQDCRLTQDGKKLYVHIFAWPFKHLHLPGLGGKVEYALPARWQ